MKNTLFELQPLVASTSLAMWGGFDRRLIDGASPDPLSHAIAQFVIKHSQNPPDQLSTSSLLVSLNDPGMFPGITGSVLELARRFLKQLGRLTNVAAGGQVFYAIWAVSSC